MNSITLTPARIVFIFVMTLLFCGSFSIAHAASPFDGMVRRPVQKQFKQSCGMGKVCEVTTTSEETIRGPILRLVEVEICRIEEKTMVCGGRHEVSGPFAVAGDWFEYNPITGKLIQTSAPTAVATR